MKDLRNVRVKEIMTSPVVTVPSDATLRQAARLIDERRISCLVVEKDGGPAGILTERDLVRSVSQGVDPATAVGALIGEPLVSVEADSRVEQALAVMEKHSIRHLPVVCSGKVAGLVTQTNIMRFSEEMLKVYSQALEEQVKRQTEELRQAGEFKDYILGMAAHDLRAPLAVITAWCELLESLQAGEKIDGLDERQIPETLLRQASQMSRLISDILDISQIHRGKLKLRPAPARIDSVIAERIGVHSMLARKKGIALRSRIDEGLPELVFDGERIGAVIDNFLSNAVKYSRSGDSIELRTMRLPEGGVRVEVSDTGIGIAEEDMPKLFTEFAKLRGKPTGDEASTGLGLAIVKKTVEAHGGRVFAASVRGKGSTFGFTLP